MKEDSQNTVKENENKIIEILKRMDSAYFNGEPEIADVDYDKLKTEFRILFPNSEYLKEVGAEVKNKYEEIALPFIIGGLDKVDIETVLSWAKKENSEIVATEKLDGNSIVCSWNNGQLIFAASRGNGIVGQNILQKGKFFIPSVPYKEKVSLRGEVLLEGDTYKDLGFKNRRNGVTGLLRRDDINPKHLSKLSIIFYEVIEPEINLETERLSFIKDVLNLRVPRVTVIEKNQINESLPEILSELLLKYKEDSTYDIDGLVLTFNNSKRENVLYPKSKVKFKVNEEAVKAEVIGISWNTTRLGMVKPVVLIKPIEMMGSTISKCSGFNLDFIESGRIGKGAIVGLVKAGDVIPYIVEVIKDAEPDIPTECPSCGSVLSRTSKDLMCNNDDCNRKRIYNVSHFFIEMGSDNISHRTIEMLGIYSIEEAYELTVEKMEKLPGFGKKKAEIIYNEIQKTLVTKPELLLSAFGMGMIGTTISKSLCSRFLFDELFEIQNPDVLNLGPITSQFFIDNIGKYKPLYSFLKSKGLQFEKKNLEMKTLKGVKFALTGAGPLKRKEYISMVEQKGGEVKSVSKDTNYLVTDNPESGSEKNKAAQKFGTKIITYEQLMDMLK